MPQLNNVIGKVPLSEYATICILAINKIEGNKNTVRLQSVTFTPKNLFSENQNNSYPLGNYWFCFTEISFTKQSTPFLLNKFSFLLKRKTLSLEQKTFSLKQETMSLWRTTMFLWRETSPPWRECSSPRRQTFSP
jgi:hypothetical protein